MRPAKGWRDGQRGEVSPLLLVLLILLVALFVFAALAGSRGHLSASGCLPRDAAGRQKLSRRWFQPKALAVKDVKLVGCAASGQILQITGSCAIEVPAIGKEPESWAEKIGAAFHNTSRRLVIKAPAKVAIQLFRDKDADPIKAKLEANKETDFTFSRGEAKLVVGCLSPGGKCQMILSQPSEDP